MVRTQPRPAAVEGETIEQSLASVLVGVVMCSCLAAAGAWGAWVWWNEKSWLGIRLNFVGGCLGLALFAGGLVWVSISLYQFVVGGKLILGHDRFQYATRWGRVVTQIPYANIAAVVLEEMKSKPAFGRMERIRIDLLDPHDPNTLNVFGGRYLLEWPVWELPLAQIHERLVKCVEAVRRGLAVGVVVNLPKAETSEQVVRQRAEQARGAEPVAGEIVSRSLIKTLGSILFILLVLAIALFRVWAWRTGTSYTNFGEPVVVPWWEAVVEVGVILGAPLAVFALVGRLLARERLILGRDRLQIVRRQRGRSTVVVQIPYANVSRCVYEVTDTERRIGFDLWNPEDLATHAENEDFKANKQQQGWHYILRGGFRSGVRRIHQKLLVALDRS